jgi:hypothetical protein
MDEHGGALSYDGLKVLWKVGLLGRKQKQDKSEGFFVHPRWCGQRLESSCARRFQLIHEQSGVGKATKARGLDHAELRFNGARSMNKKNHVRGGFKVMDLLCQHPMTGELLLFRCPTEQAEEGTVLCNLQHRDLSFPLKMMFCCKTKDHAENFNECSNSLRTVVLGRQIL